MKYDLDRLADTPRDSCAICGHNPDTPVSIWGKGDDGMSVHMAVCDECREYLMAVMDLPLAEVVRRLAKRMRDHDAANGKVRPSPKLMKHPLPPAIQFALDHINRLCGGGAWVSHDGQIISPRLTGWVVCRDGSVTGGQDAMAIARGYQFYPESLMDDIMLAEWAYRQPAPETETETETETDGTKERTKE